jgi:hypothetical protein
VVGQPHHFSPYSCEPVVCTNRTFNNTDKAGAGGNGTCESIGNDQLRCETTTNFNGIACHFHSNVGRCEANANPGQRHPCKLKKGVTIYENYGDYRYELEGGSAPKNGRGIFVATVPGLYTFPDWRGARSLKVSEGYEVCLWREGNGSGDSRIPGGYCKSGTSPNGNGFQTTDYEWDMKSFTLKKDCSNPVMLWDSDCNTTNPTKVKSGTSCAEPSSLCYKQRKEYCNRDGDHVEDKCVDFFKNKNKEADGVMRRYCARPENKDRPACNCLNSPVMSVEGGKYNPACIDPKCINGGYQTTNMTSLACPNVVDCRTQLAIQDVGGSVALDRVNVSQNCGNTTSGPAGSSGSSGSSVQAPSVQAPAVQAPSVQAPSAPPTLRRSSWSLLKIIIAILIVMQLGGLVIFMDDGIAIVGVFITTIIASVIIMFLV